MSRLSEPEIVTQERLIDLFRSQMSYDYLGDWRDRENNSNIDRIHCIIDWHDKKKSVI